MTFTCQPATVHTIQSILGTKEKMGAKSTLLNCHWSERKWSPASPRRPMEPSESRKDRNGNCSPRSGESGSRVVPEQMHDRMLMHL